MPIIIKPYFLDRGRYGYAVRWNGVFDSAMPDEATARKVAAVDDLLAALDAADFEMKLGLDDDCACDHSVGVCCCGYWRVREQMKAALEKAGKPRTPPRRAEGNS